MKIKIYIMFFFLSYQSFLLFSLNEFEEYECKFFYCLCDEGKYTSVCNVLQANSAEKNYMLLHYKHPLTKKTALLTALTHNFTLLSRLLLLYGSHPFEHDEEGLSPIHIAAMQGNPEIIQLLLEKKVPIDLQTTYSLETALHYAVLHNKHEVVDLLITAGARINTSDCIKRLPIHCAIIIGNQIITKTLLSTNKQIINAQDICGKTCAHYVTEAPSEYLTWFLKTYKKYINFSIQDIDGNTPLHNAIYHGNVLAVVSFLLLNPPLSVSNSRGLTPLELAKDLELDDIIEAIEIRIKWK